MLHETIDREPRASSHGIGKNFPAKMAIFYRCFYFGDSLKVWQEGGKNLTVAVRRQSSVANSFVPQNLLGGFGLTQGADLHPIDLALKLGGDPTPIPALDVLHSTPKMWGLLRLARGLKR